MSARVGGQATAAGAYAGAGVDLDAAATMKGLISGPVEATRTSLVALGFGSFGGAFGLPAGYRDPVLVASVDGVGTKLHLAIAWGRPEGAGRDLVNHCIDDIAVLGARPVAFLDYVASGGLEPAILAALVAGMAEACRAANIAIVGGETAQMPDTYRPGAWDLAGTIIGVAERGSLPDPGRVRKGDVLVGLPAVGLHTNGFSLARRVADALGPEHPLNDGTLADALLAPHPSYLEELLRAFTVQGVRVAAHITGGGLPGNLPRVLPEGLAARVDVGSWPSLAIFELISEHEGVPPPEMYRVFNMGLGIVLVVAPASLAELLDALPGAVPVGEVVERRGEPVVLVGL